MAPVPLPRDLLIAAKARVAHAKLQLEAAHEKMRHVRTRSDWLADRQDLALLDHLIDNLSLRQDTLALAQSEYNWTDDKSLCEIIRVNYPKLVNEVALYRWLHKKLKESMTPDELELLLNESQLDEANKEIITARIESLRNHTKWISFNRIITGGRSSSVSYLGHTPACWNTYIRLVGERLQSMEQERNDLANAALSRQSEIDQLVESRIEIYIVDQTRDQQKAFDDANKAYEDARNQCFSHFQSRLEQDFLAARIEDYAPSDDSSFRQQLEDAKTNFVRDWASRCTRASLDLEQAAAIGSVHGNVLVTARAGSGKTSTLVTRAAFLVKHCCVSPDELLLLVFNRKAAEEMRGRLQKMGCDVPHAMTFHALAYAIVHPEEALIYDSPNDTQPKLSRAFQQVLNEFMDQDRFREDIRKVMLGHFRADWDMLTRAGLTLSREEGLAFRRALAKETLQGGYVKSFGEKVIANFLFEHDIAYKYEKNHWWNGRNYRPDFTIPLGQYGVVIEYFGLAGDPDYDAEADAKRAYWRRKPDWRFIEMMPADLNEGFAHFQYLLRRRLEGCEVACRRLSEEEIWNKVRDRSITRFAQMTRTFVGRCRAAGLSPAALRDRIARHKSLSEVEATFLRMPAAIFSAYLARLSAVGEEDFSGLLERAATKIENGENIFDRKSGRGKLSKMRFVLVDEFQDFSPLFLRMLQAARRHNLGMQVFCVGDDWQAINAFAGSDLRYFERFDEHFTPAARLPITTNYRSAPCVVEFGNLLMRGRGIEARPGKNHVGRILMADLVQFEPSAIERKMYAGAFITPVVRRILFKALDDGGRVALLARRNDLPYYLGKDMGRSTLDNCLLAWTAGLSDEQKKSVSISTAHKYKGLQAETVVILDAIQRSYPLIHPDWVFTRVLGDNVQKLIEDERRLFYVACTRAINTLILITESDRESDFLGEIKGKCTTIQWQDFPPVETSGFCWNDGRRKARFET